MSQQQAFGAGGAPGTPNIEFVIGNDGTPVGPNPATHTINIIGDTTKGVSVTNTAPFTEEVSVAFATYTTPGVSSYNMTNFTVVGGAVTSNNIDIIAGTGLSGGGNVTLGGSVTLNATSPSTDLHVARFIVSAGGSADGANYTDLPTAYAAAVAATGNQTIFLQPGTYNIGTMALSPGINISAFDCDALTPSVVINGKMTANITGNCSFSGISFLNNSDNVLAISGSGACQFQFTECFINVSGTATAIVNSNPSAVVGIFSSKGDISGTDTYFNFTAGGVIIQDSFMFNSIESLTANIFNNAFIDLESSTFDCPIVASNTGGDVSIKHSTMIVLNGTCVTTSGGPNSDLIILNSHIDSNNATAISIGAGSTMTIANTSVGSNATNAIDGAGVLLYAPIAFTKSSSQVTTATQTPLVFGPSIAPEMTNVNGTVYYDGTILNSVSPGTAGDIYTSNGAGTPPSFQPPSGGGITEFFSAYLSAFTGNVTGDNTLYGPIIFDGIISNSSSSYNPATGIYTAPSTGQYCFQQTVCMVGGDSLTTEYLSFWGGSSFSARAFQLFPVPQASANTQIFSASVFCHLTMGDTVSVSVSVAGTNKNIFIYGAAPTGFATTSLFSGFKVA